MKETDRKGLAMSEIYSNNCRNAIGVFDSGLGGLTCVAELMKVMPHENIVYFGDTARIPYGTRSRETIMEYARQDVDFICKNNVKLVIAACGTVSSVVGHDRSFAGNLPFTGVVIPAAQAACKATRNGKIGVIGTAATVRSGAYINAIKSIDPNASVTSNSCSLYVPLVEAGMTDPEDIVVKTMTERYLFPLKNAGVDTVILGCTHFPMLRNAIAAYMGDDVTLISSGAEAARYSLEMLREGQLLTDQTHEGHVIYYTSDSTELFEENAKAFIGSTLRAEVRRVTLDELTKVNSK